MTDDLLRQIGAEAVTTKPLMWAGGDPHGNGQTRSDITAMTRADANFWVVSQFEVLGIQGIYTEGLADLKRIGTLVNTLVDRQLPAVFVETSVSDRNIRALIEGAAVAAFDAVGSTIVIAMFTCLPAVAQMALSARLG